jgi:hypothetical protein
MSLLLSFRSELLKNKRTTSFYFTLAAALFGPFMSMLDLVFDGVEKDHRSDILNELFTTKYMMTGAVVFPIFIILTCALLPQTEYRNNTWKQVLSSPQPRLNVFLAKFINIQGLILLFFLTNQLGMLANAVILHFTDPSLDIFNQSLNGSGMLATLGNSYVALLAMCALQFWLGLKFKNVIIPIAIGIACWFIGTILVMQMKSELGMFFPHSFHMYASFPEFKPEDMIRLLLTSVGYMILFLIGGYLDFRRRRM